MRIHSHRNMLQNHADAIPLLDREFDRVDIEREVYRTPKSAVSYGTYDPFDFMKD